MCVASYPHFYVPKIIKKSFIYDCLTIVCKITAKLIAAIALRLGETEVKLCQYFWPNFVVHQTNLFFTFPWSAAAYTIHDWGLVGKSMVSFYIVKLLYLNQSIWKLAVQWNCLLLNTCCQSSIRFPLFSFPPFMLDPMYIFSSVRFQLDNCLLLPNTKSGSIIHWSYFVFHGQSVWLTGFFQARDSQKCLGK